MSRSNSSIGRSNLRVTSSVNKIKLKQIGATVKRIESKIYHATFKVGDTELVYFYNINEDGKFFLERMKPFYRNFKVYTDENEAIKAIYEDVQYFKNAEKSHNYNKFVELSQALERLNAAYSELFLHHNVPEEELKEIEAQIAVVQNRVAELDKTTEEIKIDIE